MIKCCCGQPWCRVSVNVSIPRKALYFHNDDGTYESIRLDANAVVTLIADLQRLLAALAEKCQHDWYSIDPGWAAENLFCRKCGVCMAAALAEGESIGNWDKSGRTPG